MQQTLRPYVTTGMAVAGVGLVAVPAVASNLPQLQHQLALVEQQWFFFQNALDEKRQDTLTRATNVATTSERILEIMEAVVTGYEALH